MKFYEISGLVPAGFETDSAATARRVAADALGSGAAKRVEIRDSNGEIILDISDPDEP
ncbi:hypothetical protein G7077_03225 [Sphingomonas piscis]|uniref:DUF2188 domain-containing protein n=1 Tax=Sphingomonas piscis TaxID=2714943 RepID=A0A6G7YMU7_9SPHN|nr:hypothetical protein [Sphingomonas piscis]QIK78069.1 hypothetical protein G7077_03225 [Sphingomonas piscis]